VTLSPATPSLSVCLASYNGAPYLRAQIDSILVQLRPGDELVVSDDGSTDDTAQILASYGDRLRVVGTSRAGGVVRNFERALSAARGDLVALSDQDDVWLEGRVELIRDRLRAVTLVMTNGEVVDSELRPTGQDVYQSVGAHRGLVRNFVKSTYVGCCMAFRRELLDVALPFPSHIQWHDWYLALLGELLFAPERHPRNTILFRRHANNASSTGQRSRAGLFDKAVARLWMARALAVAVLRMLARRRRSQR
jgi:glycosyltransferase involved in cell wall biosynthesis